MSPPTCGIPRRWQRPRPLVLLGVPVLVFLLIGPFFPTNVVEASAFLAGGGRFLVPPLPLPPSSYHQFHSSQQGYAAFRVAPLYSSFLQQRPGESDSAHLQRIQALASDPVAFERAALAGSDDDNDANADEGNAYPPSATKTTTTDDIGDSPTPLPSSSRGGGYQRVEDWDREQREKLKEGGGLSWEERVQFDGLRHGNRAQQNEILRHHLKVY